MTETCTVCGEKLYPDQDWVLKPGLIVGKETEEGDYIHESCLENYEH